MLCKSTALRSRRLALQSMRRGMSSVEKGADSPIAEDGRHEIWREGIYDHDNEPKVRKGMLSLGHMVWGP